MRWLKVHILCSNLIAEFESYIFQHSIRLLQFEYLIIISHVLYQIYPKSMFPISWFLLVAVVVAMTQVEICLSFELSTFLLCLLPSKMRLRAHVGIYPPTHTIFKLFCYIATIVCQLLFFVFFHKYLNLVFCLFLLCSILCIPVSARIFFFFWLPNVLYQTKEKDG